MVVYYPFGSTIFSECFPIIYKLFLKTKCRAGWRGMILFDAEGALPLTPFYTRLRQAASRLPYYPHIRTSSFVEQGLSDKRILAAALARCRLSDKFLRPLRRLPCSVPDVQLFPRPSATVGENAQRRSPSRRIFAR